VNFRSGPTSDLGREILAPVVDDEHLRYVPEEASHHVADPRFAPKRGDERGGPERAFRG
jgi:hypothetical protein